MTIVKGAFETREMAAGAADEVIAGGFEPGQVSVLDRYGELAEVTPEGGVGRRIFVGAAIGAVVGLLVSITWGGPAPAVGLPGWELPGLLLGAVVGALVAWLAVPRRSAAEAGRYAERERAGAYVVAVQVDPGDEAKAETLLATAGAEAPIRREPDATLSGRQGQAA